MSEPLHFPGFLPEDWTNAAFKPFRDGVEIAKIYDGPPDVALLRYAPGASIPAYFHPGLETILVLSGAQSDERGTYRAGALVLNPAGTTHRTHSGAQRWRARKRDASGTVGSGCADGRAGAGAAGRCAGADGGDRQATARHCPATTRAPAGRDGHRACRGTYGGPAAQPPDHKPWRAVSGSDRNRALLPAFRSGRGTTCASRAFPGGGTGRVGCS